MRPVNRMTPKLHAAQMKTYAVVAPKDTHFRKATCAEVDCPNYLHGWKTVLDESTDLGQKQAHYIRTESGRRYTRQPVNSEGPVVYTFEAGQQCFGQHQVRIDRPEIYLVRDGDYRGNPLGTTARRHANADEWVEDFAEHQDKLATRIEEG